MKRSLKVQIGLFTATRTLLNTLFRMIYPFLGTISEGLGISFTQAAHALSVRSLSGLVGPFLAAIADQRSRKQGMVVGLALFVVGLAAIVFFPTYPAFVVMLLLTSLGKMLFDAAMHAYLGDSVPYQQRGFVMAVTEMSWSGSFFIGMPLLGFLIRRAGWMSPFPLLLVLLLVSFVLLQRLLPSTQPVEPGGTSLSNLSSVLTSSAAIAGLFLTMWLTMANEMVNLLYSVWLENSFGLQVTAMGGVAALIGISELSGEGLVTTISDRLGKRRAVALGLVLNSLAALLLPRIGNSVPGALAGLFFFYLTFEFAIVSSIPLISEILPKTRATLLALNMATALLGRGMSAWMVPYTYARSFALSTAVAALINLLALVSLYFIKIDADKHSAWIASPR